MHPEGSGTRIERVGGQGPPRPGTSVQTPPAADPGLQRGGRSPTGDSRADLEEQYGG